jgi:hypothetical protein
LFLFIFFIISIDTSINKQLEMKKDECNSMCAHDFGTYYKFVDGGVGVGAVNTVCYCKDKNTGAIQTFLT